jgi:hypothetical protein
MDQSFASFWAAGIDTTPRRDARIAAAATAASAVNLRRFSVSALRDLAADRGVPLRDISHDHMELVDRIEAQTAKVRASPAAKASLGGWLGGHTAFREFGAELEEEAFKLLTAFGGGSSSSSELDSISGAPVLTVAVAGSRVRRLGAGVRKLATSVHSHGSWEEEAIFGFLKRELRSFGPFYDALKSEHHGAADLASEVRRAG